MRKFLLLVLIPLVCAVNGTPSAQQPPAAQVPEQPATTFRTEVNFVEVHAIVTDETGAFVRNLSRDDFEILEDGRPQKPSVFYLVDLPIERPFMPAQCDRTH